MKNYLIAYIIACLVIIPSCQAQSNVLTLELLTDYERAKCIDGSSSGYYFREGTGEGKNNYLIHLQGGAWCQGSSEDEILANCVSRSQTILGSSLNWPSNITNSAILETSSNLNPSFFNWNIAYVYYCDGFAYQGNSERIYQNTTLYFRGKDNMLALFSQLSQKKGLMRASKVVLSGSSAGGIGAVNWSNYLKSILPASTLFQTISDSGFFVDDGWFDPTLWRQQLDIAYDYDRFEIMPLGCEYLGDNDNLYKCVQPVYNYKTLISPTLLLLSSYDTYVLLRQKKVKCMTAVGEFYKFQNCTNKQWDLAEQLRNITISTLGEVVVSKDNLSVWAVSCINHMFMLDNAFYEEGLFTAPFSIDSNGVTASQAIYQFLSYPDVQKAYIDLSNYPENNKCSFQNVTSQY